MFDTPPGQQQCHCLLPNPAVRHQNGDFSCTRPSDPNRLGFVQLEARKRKEEEDAAKVFEDFVASFEGEGDGRGGGKGKFGKPGGFVRGDVVNSSNKRCESLHHAPLLKYLIFSL